MNYQQKTIPKSAIILLSDKQRIVIELHQVLISCEIPEKAKIKPQKK